MYPGLLEDCGDGGMTWAMAVGLAKLLGPAPSHAGTKLSAAAGDVFEEPGQSTLDFGFLSSAPAPGDPDRKPLGGLEDTLWLYGKIWSSEVLGQASWLCCWPHEAWRKLKSLSAPALRCSCA